MENGEEDVDLNMAHGSKSRYRSPTRRVLRRIGLGVSA